MIYKVDGDLVKETQYRIFCHQVNCKGVMGSGIAKQIKETYPEVYRAYREYEPKALGEIQKVKTHDDRICINMFAQDGYGRDKCYTDYWAFEACLERIALDLMLKNIKEPVAFPYKIGCGMAGGDWNIVKHIINAFANILPQNVYIVRKSD